ncbi:MAG: hypothetical protein V2A73_03645 [Pseudomonadota bacterium]
MPECRAENSGCRIAAFVAGFSKELAALDVTLAGLTCTQRTKELATIADVVRATIRDGRFPWEGTTCRRVGDLLIGLQSKVTSGLVSSNRKEHGQLAGPLGYAFNEFPVAEIRLK